MRKVPHSFEVHSNESACRKKVCLGLEQVECSIQRGSIWGHMPWTYEELDSVVRVSPILVLFGCNVQAPHYIYKFYEEVSMGGNPTVWNVLGTLFLFERVGASRLGGWCSMRTGGRPGYWIFAVLICWIYDFMDLSDWTHMSYV